jgi:alkylation response protein AidB-like acyl-CoA dehydrogenase
MLVAVIIVSMYLQAALDVTLDYVHTREQFGQRIGEFQVETGL